MFVAIIVTLAVLLLTLFAEQFMSGGPRVGDKESWVTLSKVGAMGWSKAVIGAIICFLITYFSPKLFADSKWLIVMLSALIVMLIWICVEWHRNIYPDIYEMVPCLLLTVVIGGLAIFVASRIGINLIANALIMWLAIAMTVFTIMYIVVTYLARNHGLKWLVPLFALFAVVFLLGSSIGTGAFAASMAAREQQEAIEAEDDFAIADADANDEVEDTEAETFPDDIHFYNDDVQGGKVDDDFDFGPNPFVKEKDVNYYIDDFTDRRFRDPALLAATMLALDGTLGTDYLGEVLYEGYDERLTMLEKADAAAHVLVHDPALFVKANTAVNKFFDSASKVELKKLVGLKDQLYMYNGTVSGIPGIVSYVSDFKEGWCLVYTFQIKDGSSTQQTIAFHIPCGYQWTNGAEKIDVTPEKKPDNPPQNPPKDPPQDDPPHEDPPPQDDPPKKDPTKAPPENTEENDDTGPGPSTNNKNDSQHSTKDTKDSTANSGKTHEEVKKDQEDKKKVNETQKTGNDSSKPSTTPPKQNTKVDNNGDKINTPTKVNESGTAAGKDNNGTISVPD